MESQNNHNHNSSRNEMLSDEQLAKSIDDYTEFLEDGFFDEFDPEVTRSAIEAELEALRAEYDRRNS